MADYEWGTGKTVREHMSMHPRTIGVGSSLAEALALMKEHEVRHLPVLNAEGSVVGVLSERDVARLRAGRGARRKDVSVEEVMTRAPYCVTPETPLAEAAAIMARRKFGCAIVLEKGVPVGILTTVDTLRALTAVEPHRHP